MKYNREATAELPPLQLQATSKLRALPNIWKLLEMVEDLGIGEPTVTKGGTGGHLNSFRSIGLGLLQAPRTTAYAT